MVTSKPPPDTSLAQLDAVCEQAGRAARAYAATTPDDRAAFLEAAAAAIEALGDDLLTTADDEPGAGPRG